MTPLDIATKRAVLAGRWLAIALDCLRHHDLAGGEYALDRVDYVLELPHQLLLDMAPELETVVSAYEAHE